mgnify:CR=1 FL=1|tara:strand:- start:869 stop:1591 length:723 start_codon:yes stop_codon:yes gene_type:complete
MSIIVDNQVSASSGWMRINAVLTWAEARDGTTASNAYAISSYLTVASTTYGRTTPYYNCSRVYFFLRFGYTNPGVDPGTQGFIAPYSGDIESATLYVYRYTGGGDKVVLVKSMASRTHPGQFAKVFFPDGDPVGGDSMTLYSDSFDNGPADGWSSWELNAAGLEGLQNSIAGNGPIPGTYAGDDYDFPIALVSLYDLDNITPTNANLYTAFRSETYFDTTLRPYLRITYKDPTVFFGVSF